MKTNEKNIGTFFPSSKMAKPETMKILGYINQR